MHAFHLRLHRRTSGGQRRSASFVGKHPLQRKRRTERNDGLGLVGHDDVGIQERHAFLEHAHERGVEGQRPTFENDGGNDIEPLRETAQRLLRDSVERREGDILFQRPLIDERLDIGLREHAAPTRDTVERASLRGSRVKLFHGNLQQTGYLVEKRPRATGA